MLSLCILSKCRLLLVSTVSLLLIAVAPIKRSMSPMRLPWPPAVWLVLLAEDPARCIIERDHFDRF